MRAGVLGEIRDFWFGPLPAFDSFPEDKFALWFMATPDQDAEIAARFGPALDEAGRNGLAVETLGPTERLGAIILLDQMSRNIHRGSPRAYDTDPLARKVAAHVVAARFEPYKVVERVFAILPFGHSESLTDQDRALELFAAHVTPYCDPQHFFYKAGQRQSQLYRDIIARFGRFPFRNPVLGRQTTPEEADFLAQTKVTPF